MSDIIQKIGSRGTFNVKEPYKAIIIPDAVYNVVDMGLLTTLMKRNNNLEDSIYFQHGISAEIYKRDLETNITVVVLEDEAGRQFYIPEYAFESVAKNDGKYYQHTVLSVEMGAHVTDIDLTVLKEAISDNVYNLYGVKPRVKDFKTSDKRMITNEEHLIIVNRRKLAQSDSSNYKLLLDEALEREKVYKQTISDLEEYILNNCP